jgi:hypothetical protein
LSLFCSDGVVSLILMLLSQQTQNPEQVCAFAMRDLNGDCVFWGGSRQR